jgi:hypothetical protein
MHRLLLLLAGFLVSGCEQKRSFDQRYQETQEDLEQRMNRLDIEANASNVSASSKQR